MLRTVEVSTPTLTIDRTNDFPYLLACLLCSDDNFDLNDCHYNYLLWRPTLGWPAIPLCRLLFWVAAVLSRPKRFGSGIREQAVRKTCCSHSVVLQAPLLGSFCCCCFHPHCCCLDLLFLVNRRLYCFTHLQASTNSHRFPSIALRVRLRVTGFG